MIQDMRGVKLEEGDRIIYGKSDRDNPLSLGYLVEILPDEVVVQGDNNVRVGRLPIFKDGKQERILVLPDDY